MFSTLPKQNECAKNNTYLLSIYISDTSLVIYLILKQPRKVDVNITHLTNKENEAQILNNLYKVLEPIRNLLNSSKWTPKSTLYNTQLPILNKNVPLWVLSFRVILKCPRMERNSLRD